MFLTRLTRASVALSIATVLANTALAVATEQSITPMAGPECEVMARKISQAAGFPLKTRVGKPDLSGFDGNACLMSGRATGLKTNFADVQKRLNAVLADWTPLNEFAADDGGSTQQGFSKASQRLVFQLTNYPPRGTCENVVIAACKVPLRRWPWTLKVVAFSISSGS
jgi:hypothetical protein